jgi:hypothetical protein
MKKILPFIILILVTVFFTCCEKEEGIEEYDAAVQIDSLHQDTIHFGANLIPGNLHVFYSVINNDFADIHSYYFTIHALNSDSVTYNTIIRSNKGVQGNSTVTGEEIIGIGQAGYSSVEIQDIIFE